MKLLALLSLLLAGVSRAQIPPPSNRSHSPATAPSAGTSRDVREWNGPLVPLSGQDAFYRTFSAGLLPHFQNPGVIDPSTMLVGFEISTSQGALSSLQPFYLANGRRVPGVRAGEIKGARSQLLAREGYAVREVRLSAVDVVAGLHVIFARIHTDGTLSDTDVYSSDPNGRAALSMNAGGLPLCGVLASGHRSIDGLALLVSKNLVDRAKPALAPRARATIAAQGSLPLPPGTISANTTPAPLQSAPPPALPPALPPGATPLEPASRATPKTPIVPISPATLTTPVDPVAALAEAGEIVRTTGESLIFVEGADSQGSGFLCTLNGKRVLLTNQHVIRGNPGTKFTTLNQATLQVGAARAAAGHDIIAYDVPEALPALEATMDFQSVTVGDKVVVLGNTEGARVIKPLPGVIAGVGPNLVEITSEFLPGNSGSPIIHLKSGKVIGIATYAIVRDVNSLTGQKQPSVRRFGYRLDSVQNWQPINWALYQGEAVATQKITDFSSAIIRLFMDLRTRQFDPSNHTDSRLRPALSHLSNLDRRGTVVQDRLRNVQNFLGEIRNVTQRDVNDLRPRLRYDFFQRELAEESKFRAEIYKGLGEVMQRLR